MTGSGFSFAEACTDPHLFGPWFTGDSWARWRVVDKALFGERLDPAEAATFRELTGRDDTPDKPATEAWLIVGRRGGKDVKAAAIAVYLATIGAELFGWRQRLARGEKGVVQVLAVDRDQAKVCFGYCQAFLEQPMLKRLVRRETADTIELSNSIAIEVTTNDRRRVRGRTVIAAIFDEVAHWRSENTQNPDKEVYRAVKPAMATMPGALLIGISSPYARRGLLWEKHEAHWGKAGTILVVKAPTWVMNPTVPRNGEVIGEAYDTDPEWAAAEYGAEFRADLESLLRLEAVQACIDSGIRERPPSPTHEYTAFCDPSGGSAELDDARHRAQGRHDRHPRRLARGPAAVQSGSDDAGVRRCAAALPDRQGQRRPLRRRMGDGRLPQGRDLLCPKREGEIATLSRPAAAGERDRLCPA